MSSCAKNYSRCKIFSFCIEPHFANLVCFSNQYCVPMFAGSQKLSSRVLSQKSFCLSEIVYIPTTLIKVRKVFWEKQKHPFVFLCSFTEKFSEKVFCLSDIVYTNYLDKSEKSKKISRVLCLKSFLRKVFGLSEIVYIYQLTR